MKHTQDQPSASFDCQGTEVYVSDGTTNGTWHPIFLYSWCLQLKKNEQSLPSILQER